MRSWIDSCSSRIVFNVPDAHTTGVEFEFTAPAGDDWRFGLSGSFINAEFDSTVVDGTGAIIGGLAEGNRLPSVPQTQLSANVTRLFDNPFSENGEGYLTASVQTNGTRYTQPGDQVSGAGAFVSGLPFGGATGNEVTNVDLKLNAYEIFNLTAGLDFENWSLQVYATNLFDKNTNLSFDRERGGRARLGFRTNTPRTVGLTARFNY